MKAQREHLDFLRDIMDMMVKVEQFTSGMTFDEFVQDDKTVLAVTRAMELIGETTKHIRNQSGVAILTSHGQRWQGCATN